MGSLIYLFALFALFALIPAAITGFVVFATTAEQRTAHPPRLPRIITTASFGGVSLIALACIGIVPGMEISSEYQFPFYVWAFPLAMVCSAIVATALHRLLTTSGTLGSGLAGGTVALLAILLASLVISLAVAPAIAEALGMAFVIVFVLGKSGWLPLAVLIGAVTGIVVNRVARRKCLGPAA